MKYSRDYKQKYANFCLKLKPSVHKQLFIDTLFNSIHSSSTQFQLILTFLCEEPEC